MAVRVIYENYTDSCKLCRANRDHGTRPQPPQELQQFRPGQRDAAVRRVPRVVVQEDAAPAAGHGGCRVVLHDRELAIGDGRPPERLAAAPKRRRHAASHVPEAVVRGRPGILIPPVAATETAVGEPDAWVRVETIDR